MSQRILTSVLQIALVVLCPFIEVGHCCGTCEAPSEHAENGCEHHSEDASSVECEHDAHETPCNHECPHGDEHSSCVCNGAVFPSASVIRIPAPSPNLIWRFPRKAGVALFCSNACVDSFGNANALLAVSGREIRAQIESLLI